jgi:hypothetical protein
MRYVADNFALRIRCIKRPTRILAHLYVGRSRVGRLFYIGLDGYTFVLSHFSLVPVYMGWVTSMKKSAINGHKEPVRAANLKKEGTLGK